MHNEAIIITENHAWGQDTIDNGKKGNGGHLEPLRGSLREKPGQRAIVTNMKEYSFLTPISTVSK